MEPHLVLYDGVCGLCNRFVRWTIAHDPAGAFRFAPLQGARAREILRRHGRDPEALDTVCLILDPGTPGERLLDRGHAALEILARLGAPWRWAAPLRRLPAWMLNPLYNIIARIRYRVFGKYDTCPIPDARVRSRFIDL